MDTCTHCVPNFLFRVNTAVFGIYFQHSNVINDLLLFKLFANSGNGNAVSKSLNYSNTLLWPYQETSVDHREAWMIQGDRLNPGQKTPPSRNIHQ